MRTKIYFLRGENRFVVYVGKTHATLKDRLYSHLYEARKGHSCKKCNGIRKMLREGKTPTITLQTEVEGDGCNAERAYIKWLRSYGIDLWNTTDGGEGTSGLRDCHKRENLSKSTLKKMSDAHIGRSSWNKNIVTPELVRRKISRSEKGRVPWNKDKHLPEKMRLNMREGHKKHKDDCRCMCCMAHKGTPYSKGRPRKPKY